MNKRYMDFVPKGGKGQVATKQGSAEPEIRMPAPATVIQREKVVVRRVRPKARRVRPEVQQARPEVKRAPQAPRTQVRPQPEMQPKTRVQREVGPKTRLRRKVGPKAQARPQPQVQPAVTGVIRRQELEASEIPFDPTMLDDPLERPVSEFADLEQLAQEIEEVTRGGVIEEEMQFAAAGANFSLKERPQFGVIEDFQPRFLNTEVEKRPLSGALALEPQEAQTEVKPAQQRAKAGNAKIERKTRNVRNVGDAPAAGNAGINSAAERTRAARQTKMQIPKARFINQNKVAKRPLSKTAYAEPGYGTVSGTRTGVSAAGGMVRGGATIAGGATGGKAGGAKMAKKIENAGGALKVKKNAPKGGAAGMICAIILTVILGAAVGTVAFLLLPK